MNNDITKDRKNIKTGVVLSYLGMAVSIVGTLLVSNRVLNYIGDYNYGLYSFVNSITTWLTVVSSALTASFLRFTTIEAKNNEGDVSRTNTLYLKLLSFLGILILLLGLSIIGFLYFSRVNIGKYGWEDSKLMYLLFGLSILNIAITMPSSIFTLFINYRKKFIFGRIVTIGTLIFNFIGHFFIAFFTKNIILISAFSIFITLLTLACNSIYSKKCLNISFAKTTIKEKSNLVHAILIFSSVLLFNSIVDQINSNVDKTLLGIFATPVDVTIYQMGLQLATYLTTMSIAVSGVFAPTIHELVVSKDQEGINTLFLKISKIQSIIICCVAFGFLSCGYEFIIWWIGGGRIGAFYVAAGLMLVNVCPLTLNASIEIQQAENKHLFRAVCYFALAILNIAISIVFLVIFDSEQSIYACLAGTILTKIMSHWIAMNIYNKKIIKLPVGQYLINLLTYVAIGLCSTLFVFGLKNSFFHLFNASTFVKLIIEGLAFVFLYLVSISIFNHNYLTKQYEKLKARRRKK